MNKLFVTIFILLVLALIGFSIFGPWDTYRIAGEGDMLSRNVTVVDLPTWVGDGLRLFRKDIQTQTEMLKEQEEWYNNHPKEKAEKEKYERWLMARGMMRNAKGECIITGEVKIERHGDRINAFLITDVEKYALIPSPERNAAIYSGGRNVFKDMVNEMDGKEMTITGDLIDNVSGIRCILVKQIWKTGM